MQTGNLNYDNLCEKFIAVGYPEIFDIKFFDKAERKFVSTTFDKGKNTFEMSVGKDGITTIAVYCDRSPEDYMGK